MTCPFKVGDKIEGKEVINSLLGFGRKELWHVATVERVEDDLILVCCPEIFGEQRVWAEYQEGWFREFQEEKKE